MSDDGRDDAVSIMLGQAPATDVAVPRSRAWRRRAAWSA
jgi:hypothetical protein